MSRNGPPRRGKPLPEILWAWLPSTIGLLLLAGILLSHQNLALFLSINGLYQVTGSALWAHITVLGDGFTVVLCLLLLLRRRPDIVGPFLMAALIALLGLRLGKQLIDLPRPPGLLSPDSFHLIGPGYKLTSFPSGHTTIVFTLAGVIILRISRRGWRAVVFSLALLIGISRVVVGIHWPIDVVGGAILGWLSACLGARITDRFHWTLGPKVQKVMGSILFLACFYCLFFYDPGYAEARWFYRLLFVLGLGVGGYELGKIFFPHYRWKGWASLWSLVRPQRQKSPKPVIPSNTPEKPSDRQ